MSWGGRTQLALVVLTLVAVIVLIAIGVVRIWLT
jgi:hypothetical protein